jgi:hypothetical protein
VEKFGAGSGAEGVQAFAERSLELVGTHLVGAYAEARTRVGA